MTRTEAAEAVMAELDKATAKFPQWPNDPLHAIAIIGEELGELTQAALQCAYEPHKATREDVRKEAVQVAAMAIRFLMSLDEYAMTRSVQHSQDASDSKAFNALCRLEAFLAEGIERDIDAMTEEELNLEIEKSGIDVDAIRRRVTAALVRAKDKARP